jgi:hypothetical protein
MKRIYIAVAHNAYHVRRYLIRATDPRAAHRRIDLHCRSIRDKKPQDYNIGRPAVYRGNCPLLLEQLQDDGGVLTEIHPN